jgi:hypothetical protein
VQFAVLNILCVQPVECNPLLVSECSSRTLPHTTPLPFPSQVFSAANGKAKRPHFLTPFPQQFPSATQTSVVMEQHLRSLHFPVWVLSNASTQYTKLRRPHSCVRWRPVGIWIRIPPSYSAQSPLLILQ